MGSRVQIRVLTITLAIVCLAAPLAVEAQQQRGRSNRVGFLDVASLNAASRCRQAVDGSFRELGYAPDQDIILEYRVSGGQLERQRQIAAELVQRPVDVIIAGPDSAIAAAKEATSRVPIVMAFSTNPVDRGFVQSLRRPGGNITGLSAVAAPETFVGKQLSLLQEIVPNLSRVAILTGRTASGAWSYNRVAEHHARELGIAGQLVYIDSAEGFEAAFATARRDRAEAAYVFATTLAMTHRQKVADLAIKYGIPIVYPVRAFVDAGGLMSYGPNLTESCRRLPYYVDKILKGAKPGDLPVEQPIKFELVINLKTAKALGLTIPPSLLLRADEVIE